MRRRHRSARRAGAYALLVALLVSVAACADADDGEHPGFTASATLHCVKSREPVRDVNTNADPALSPLALLSGVAIDRIGPPIDASGGGFTLKFDSGNSVVISFHGSVADAKRDVVELRLSARAFGVALAQRKANATLAWRTSPSRADADLVKGCLSKGGGPIPIYEQDPSLAKSYRYTDKELAAMTSACRRRGFERSACACFMKWAQQRYSITALLALAADEEPVRAALEHCGRR
jgi:hypothetical protein